jgi:class 3 adenylate cyclase
LIATEALLPSNRPTRPTAAVPLEPTRTAPEAERRQLTVMFCDLADSTILAQQLDPEDLREVTRAYQSTAAAVIQQYAGYIAQYLGDGLLVYFGWPVAHEDDALRAVHAGLGILEAVTTQLKPRLQQEKDVQVAVRVGMHTGPVVVGEMGGGGRQEHLATGDTVHITARLEGLAAPNTVPAVLMGVFGTARQHLEQGIALSTSHQHPAPRPRAGVDPEVSCRLFAALTLWFLGYAEQALRMLHVGLNRAQELAHPFSAAQALNAAGLLLQLRREWQAVHEHAETTRLLAMEHGFAVYNVTASLQRGLALAGRGTCWRRGFWRS